MPGRDDCTPTPVLNLIITTKARAYVTAYRAWENSIGDNARRIPAERAVYETLKALLAVVPTEPA